MDVEYGPQNIDMVTLLGERSIPEAIAVSRSDSKTEAGYIGYRNKDGDLLTSINMAVTRSRADHFSGRDLRRWAEAW